MRSRLLLISVVFILIAAIGYIWAQNRYGHIDPKEIYSKEERAELALQADRGDARASWRLYLYYSAIEKNPKQREKWLLVGANLGDDRSIYSLAMLYANVDSQLLDLQKATHWANVLAQYDAEEAESVMQEIEFVRRTQKIEMNRP